MNSKRSYLETLNAGRQRRAHSSIEQLNQSLETLEQRIGRNADSLSDRPLHSDGDRDDLPRATPAAGTSRRGAPSRRSTAVRARRCRARRKARRRISRWHVNSTACAARRTARCRRQDRRRAEGPARGTAPSDDDRAGARIRRAAQGYPTRLQLAACRQERPGARRRVRAAFGRHTDAVRKERRQDLKLLRLELEQVRGALDSLAREDTVRSVDRRWDDFDARFSKFEDRFDAQSRGRTPDPAIEALTSRLEQINDAVHGLPESLSLRSLEEKVRTLAGAVDHFARQQDGSRNVPFDVIEERLDEISRAIVASSVSATTPLFDPEPFERIEARITSLAHQIEELVEDRPGGEVMDRLNLLSQRVDEIAASGKLPDKAIERLAGQVATIADKLDRTPDPLDTDHIFRGIEQRFDMLSDLLDRRQGDAMEHGQAVFRDLERRLEELAGRLDEHSARPAIDSAGIMNVIDARLEELAGRLDERTAQPAVDSAGIMNVIDARLEELAGRIDERGSAAAANSAGIMNPIDARFEELAHRLESRTQAPDLTIAHLEERLEDISSRLERSSAQPRRSRHHPQSRNAGLRTVAASSQPGAPAGIRRHRASDQRWSIRWQATAIRSWKRRDKPPRMRCVRSPARHRTPRRYRRSPTTSGRSTN